MPLVQVHGYADVVRYDVQLLADLELADPHRVHVDESVLFIHLVEHIA